MDQRYLPVARVKRQHIAIFKLSLGAARNDQDAVAHDQGRAGELQGPHFLGAVGQLAQGDGPLFAATLPIEANKLAFGGLAEIKDLGRLLIGMPHDGQDFMIGQRQRKLVGALRSQYARQGVHAIGISLRPARQRLPLSMLTARSRSPS